MFWIVELGVLMISCVSVHTDFDLEPHSVSTPVKARILVGKKTTFN